MSSFQKVTISFNIKHLLNWTEWGIHHQEFHQSAAAVSSDTSECTQKGVETCSYYIVQSQKAKNRRSFFSHYWQRVSAASRGIRRQNGGWVSVLIVGHVQRCPYVSRHLWKKWPSSLLDCQLKGKRKRGVRQKKWLNILQIYLRQQMLNLWQSCSISVAPVLRTVFRRSWQ